MSSTTSLNVLSIGATGSIGRLVVTEALRQGHHVRALVRPGSRADFPAACEVVTGHLTSEEDLARALERIDAVVFTHGTHAEPCAIEDVDYGAVRRTLDALAGRQCRIALMTAIGVTVMDSDYNRTYEAHDWKRRSERLVRASGNPYTIVRPGWFDYNAPDELALRFLQGDTRRAGSPADGVISRAQIAQVLVSALTDPAADHKTLELVAETGPAPQDLSPLFAALAADPVDGVDGVKDPDNFPLDAQPQVVADDLARIAGYASGRA